MYSFQFVSGFTENGMDNYLMHILFDGVIVNSSFVQFQSGTSQDILDEFANNFIDSLEGF